MEPAVPTEGAAEARARKRLAAEKNFYIHLTVYCSVIALLALINWFTGSRPWWFLWPAGGWGLGLAIHALTVFGLFGSLRDWEDRRLRELLDEERTRGKP
jgi:hypothetical protein